MKKIFILLCIALSMLTGCNKKNDGTVNLILGHENNDTHPVSKAMVYFADRVDKDSNGKMHISIFSNGQLGKEGELIELIQAGAIDLTLTSAAPLEGFDKGYGVFSMPYIFRDKKHNLDVLSGPVGEEILGLTKDKGFVGLSFFDAGARSFYGHKGIEKPSDLKGLKMRVQASNTAIGMVKLLGGSPTPLSYGELYTALQQNVVDGAENSIISYVEAQHLNVAKSFSYDEHTMVPAVFLIGNETLKRLNDKQKAILKQASKEAFTYEVKLWADREKEAKKIAESKGTKFFYPDKAPFQKMVQPLYKEVQKDPEMNKLITEIQAVK